MAFMRNSGSSRRSAQGLLGIVAAVAFATSLEGRVTEAYDDGLLVSSRPAEGHLGSSVQWLKVETDPCGSPAQAQSRQSLLTQSGMDDEEDQSDVLSDLEDLGPADQDWAVLALSLSGRSDIAVVSDGVGKTCDDESALDGDEAGAEAMAEWTRDPLSRRLRRLSAPRQEAAPYIA